jgi:hypothetical protein
MWTSDVIARASHRHGCTPSMHEHVARHALSRTRSCTRSRTPHATYIPVAVKQFEAVKQHTAIMAAMQGTRRWLSVAAAATAGGGRLADLEGFLARARARLAPHPPPRPPSATVPAAAAAWTATDEAWLDVLRRQAAAPNDDAHGRTHAAIAARLLGYSDPLAYVS